MQVHLYKSESLYSLNDISRGSWEFFHGYVIIHKQKPSAFCKAWIYERSKMLDYSKLKSSLLHLSQNDGALDE